MPIKILIVDDEIKANKVVQKNYKKQINNLVDFSCEGREALKIIEVNQFSYALVLINLKMSPIEGIELINSLTEKNLPIKIIVMSAYVTQDEINKYFENNERVLAFLEKPFNIKKLNEIIQQNFPLDSSAQDFDYSQLDSETSVFIREQTEEIRELMRRTAQGILDIGQKLLEIKEKLGHGSFLNWLKKEFEWSELTAQRFMQVARQFESYNLLDLNIAPSALYILSAPSTQVSVREEALSRAQAGENITYKTAKEIKQKYQLISKVEPETRLVSDVQGSLSGRLRTRAIKSLPKQEVLAVITEPTTDKGRAVVRRGSWYQLGEKHLLYCGEPNSPQFKQRLPKEIALNITFPPSAEWQLATHVRASSEIAFFSQYQDVDLASFKKMIQLAFEIYTEEKEFVVFSFLPEPELLVLAHLLGCHCFVAEPSVKKCEIIIDRWKSHG